MDFFTPSIIISNPIPDETRIYFAKDTAIVNIVFSLIFMAMGAFTLQNEVYILGVPVCIISLVFIFIEVRFLFNNNPQIIINREGIKTSGTSFHPWSEVERERVSGNINGRGARPYLEYDHLKSQVRVKVDPLNIRPQDLDLLLKYYRSPWEFNQI